MQHHRILILIFAAALVSATVLAFTTAAHAEAAIVKLVSAESAASATLPTEVRRPAYSR